MPNVIAQALANALPATAPTSGWVTLGAPVTQPFSGSAVTTDGTRIYMTHGFAGGTVSAAGRSIDATGAPTPMPNGSVARQGVAGAWCNGKHYAINGSNGGSSPLQSAEAYTPAGSNGASGVWTTISQPPFARVNASAASIGNFVYVAGGSSVPSNGLGTADSGKADFFRYDTVNTVWATLASLPAARTQGAMVAVGTKLYYLAGLDTSGAAQSTVFVFDTVAGTWSTLGTALPVTFSACSATVVGSSVFIFYNAAFTSLRLDTATSLVSTVSGLSSHGSYAGAVTIGSTIYAVSGTATANVDALDTTAGNYVAKVKAAQQYLASTDPLAYAASRKLPATPPVAAWEILPAPSEPRYTYAGGRDAAGRMYAMAGTSGSTRVTTSRYYDPATGTWASVATAAPYGGQNNLGGQDSQLRIYHVGGTDATNIAVTSAWRFDPATQAFLSIAPHPVGKASGAGVVDALDRFWTFGGYIAGDANNTATNTVHRYDPVANTWTALTATPMPYATNACMGARDGAGNLYVTGGTGDVTTAYRFTMASSTWAAIAPMLVGRRNHLMTMDSQGRVMALGGSLAASSQSMERFDPATSTWTALPSSLQPHSLAPLIVDASGTRLYALGGSNSVGQAERFTDTASGYPALARATKALAALSN